MASLEEEVQSTEVFPCGPTVPDRREVSCLSELPLFPSLLDRKFKTTTASMPSMRHSLPERTATTDNATEAHTSSAVGAVRAALVASLEVFNFRDIEGTSSVEREFVDSLDSRAFLRFQRDTLIAFAKAASDVLRSVSESEQRMQHAGLFAQDVIQARVQAVSSVQMQSKLGRVNISFVALQVLRSFRAGNALTKDEDEDVQPPDGFELLRLAEARAGLGASAASSHRMQRVGASRQIPGLPTSISNADSDFGRIARLKAPTPPPSMAAASLSSNSASSNSNLLPSRALLLWKQQAGHPAEDIATMRTLWAADRGVHATASSLQHAANAAAKSAYMPLWNPVTSAADIDLNRATVNVGSTGFVVVQPPVVASSANAGVVGASSPNGAWKTASRNGVPFLPVDSPLPAVMSLAALQTHLKAKFLRERGMLLRKIPESERSRDSHPSVDLTSHSGAERALSARTATAARNLERGIVSAVNDSLSLPQSYAGLKSVKTVGPGVVLSQTRVNDRLVIATLGSTNRVPAAGAISGGPHITHESRWETEAQPWPRSGSGADVPRLSAPPLSPLSAHPPDAGGHAGTGLVAHSSNARLRPISELSSSLSLTARSITSQLVEVESLPRFDSAVAMRHTSGSAEPLRSLPREGFLLETAPFASLMAPVSSAAAETHVQRRRRSTLLRPNSLSLNRNLARAASVAHISANGAAALAAVASSKRVLAAPPFHRPEVLAALALLHASAQVEPSTQHPGLHHESRKALRQRRGSDLTSANAGLQLRFGPSASAVSAAEVSVGLKGAGLSSSMRDSPFAESLIRLREAAMASMLQPSSIATRAAALGTLGVRVGPLASTLRPVRSAQQVTFPAHPERHAMASKSTGEMSSYSSLRDSKQPVSQLNNASSTLVSKKVAESYPSDERSLASASACAPSPFPTVSLVNAERVSAFTEHISHILDALEMPTIDRIAFIARHTHPRLAGQLANVCEAWNSVVKGVLQAEVLKHFVAHAFCARDALDQAFRHASLSGAHVTRSNADGVAEDSSEAVMWVPVLPPETLEFLVALPIDVFLPEDGLWCRNELARVPANAVAERFLWTLPSSSSLSLLAVAVRSDSRGSDRKSQGIGDRKSPGMDADEVREECVSALAAVMVTAATADFAQPPLHAPALLFRPVFEQSIEFYDDATELTSNPAPRTLNASHEPAVRNVAAMAARAESIFERLRQEVINECLHLTTVFGDVVKFRGASVVVALRKEPRVGLIPECTLQTLSSDAE